MAIPGLERDGPGGSAASTTSAKEVANIDAVSGGRLTFGIALVAGRLTTGLRGARATAWACAWRTIAASTARSGQAPRLDACPAEPGSASPGSCQNSSCVSVRRGRRLPQSHNQGEACSPGPPMGWDRPEESPYKQKEKTMNLISG